MLDFSQMLARFAVALVLGAIMGLERESAGKEAGVRTGMLVSGGAALFTIAGLALPYLLAANPEAAQAIIINNAGVFGVIANIVVGIGFIGGGIIIKTTEHVHGLTTAAVVWVMAAIGMLAALGLTEFAAVATVVSAGMLFILRKLGIYELVKPKNAPTSKDV
ncbi:MAG: MgtC/SapB family protein [Candidatus Liptonbacteria bacterium]|nr:MgtC/SapB family protein [Candidatus Liptonbacteria bacterium]